MGGRRKFGKLGQLRERNYRSIGYTRCNNNPHSGQGENYFLAAISLPPTPFQLSIYFLQKNFLGHTKLRRNHCCTLTPHLNFLLSPTPPTEKIPSWESYAKIASHFLLFSSLPILFSLGAQTSVGLSSRLRRKREKGENTSLSLLPVAAAGTLGCLSRNTPLGCRHLFSHICKKEKSL